MSDTTITPGSLDWQVQREQRLYLESCKRWELICKIRAYATMDADPDRPNLSDTDAMTFIREALAEFDAEGKP